MIFEAINGSPVRRWMLCGNGCGSDGAYDLHGSSAGHWLRCSSDGCLTVKTISTLEIHQIFGLVVSFPSSARIICESIFMGSINQKVSLHE